MKPNRQRVLDAWLSNPNVSLRDLAERLELSLGSVYHHVTALEKAGLITGRNHSPGNLSGKYTRRPHPSPLPKGEGTLSKVRSAAARAPRKRDSGLAKRIDRVVRKALQVNICPPIAAVQGKAYQTFVPNVEVDHGQ